jgi:hypothetical protein
MIDYKIVVLKHSTLTLTSSRREVEWTLLDQCSHIHTFYNSLSSVLGYTLYQTIKIPVFCHCLICVFNVNSFVCGKIGQLCHPLCLYKTNKIINLFSEHNVNECRLYLYSRFIKRKLPQTRLYRITCLKISIVPLLFTSTGVQHDFAIR